MKAILKSQIENTYQEAKSLCDTLESKSISHTMKADGERFMVLWAQLEEASNIQADFSLVDEVTGEEIAGGIEAKSNLGLALSFEGYGDCCSCDDSGAPIYIEKYEGKLMQRVYADINSEDPTHNIDLENAALSKRVTE